MGPAWVAWTARSHVFHGSCPIVSQRRSEHLQSRSEEHVRLRGPVRGHCRDRARLVGYGGRLAWVRVRVRVGVRVRVRVRGRVRVRVRGKLGLTLRVEG